MFHPLILLDPTPHEAAPFTLEYLLHKLMGVASKWQSLGKALSLDKDLLNEITNNEGDEACLQVMLEQYMKRILDMNHSWEEIDTALKKISEEETAAGTGTIMNNIIKGRVTCKIEKSFLKVPQWQCAYTHINQCYSRCSNVGIHC